MSSIQYFPRPLIMIYFQSDQISDVFALIQLGESLEPACLAISNLQALFGLHTIYAGLAWCYPKSSGHPYHLNTPRCSSGVTSAHEVEHISSIVLFSTFSVYHWIVVTLNPTIQIQNKHWVCNLIYGLYPLDLKSTKAVQPLKQNKTFIPQRQPTWQIHKNT